MNKTIAFLCAGAIALLASAAVAIAVTPEESLKKNFPGIAVDSVAPARVPGLYEVVSGRQIFYYSPEAESIVGGPIVMKGNRNVTAERLQELEQKHQAAMAAKAKDLPLDKAVKIGNGKNTVIEFTDPDCSFCRKAAQFFTGRKDVTKYIFFYPLDMHKNAEPKVRYILCARDRAKAYEEAMTGKLDNMKFKACKNSSVDELIRLHKGEASRLGVTGTPFFLVNGQPVSGANIPLIEKLLGQKNP